MQLPRENVLDVLQCVDFATLLALQRSGFAFYDVIHHNLSVLPRLRVFHFYLDLALVHYKLQENVEGDFSTVLRYADNDEELVPYTDDFDYSTLHPFAATVGTNFLYSAIIASSLGEMQAEEFDMRKAVEALPALKHIRDLSFECRCLMHTSYAFEMETLEELILSPLDNLQCLELGEMNNRTDWTFLRKDWALRLRSLSVQAHGLFYEGKHGLPEIDASGQAEILEYCTDFVHLPKGKSKKLEIKGWAISSEFLQRIVKTVSECKDWLTVIVDGAPGFVGNDADYTRFEVPRKNHIYVGFVRYSACDGSHCVFVHTFGERPTIAVTNNPFVTSWDDTYKWDIEGF